MRFATVRSSGPSAPSDRYVRLDGTRAFALDGAPWLGGVETGESFAWKQTELGCPVRPSKIVGIGRNYAAHARELGHEIPGEPLLFLKPPSALVGPGAIVKLPPESKRVEHEAELTVVIGRRARNVPAAAALGYVLGYTCGCDVTARDLQRRDVQFTRSKGFDTFCPVGPWIETDLDPAALRVRCAVGGRVRQDGTTAQMLFDVPALISFISGVMTLEPGDIVLTGTPDGTGPIEAGDALEVEVSGIGVLKLHVES
jgi:2-keto-4-pentenoate hydratase/2-oxohepta-3-ene-1,7-dioic acid hydratase in catechol pathway